MQGQPSQHTLVPLLILLAQQMQIVAASHASRELTVIVDLFDKCQQTLYQARSFPRCLASCISDLCPGSYCQLHAAC